MNGVEQALPLRLFEAAKNPRSRFPSNLETAGILRFAQDDSEGPRMKWWDIIERSPSLEAHKVIRQDADPETEGPRDPVAFAQPQAAARLLGSWR